MPFGYLTNTISSRPSIHKFNVFLRESGSISFWEDKDGASQLRPSDGTSSISLALLFSRIE